MRIIFNNRIVIEKLEMKFFLLDLQNIPKIITTIFELEKSNINLINQENLLVPIKDTNSVLILQLVEQNQKDYGVYEIRPALTNRQMKLINNKFKIKNKEKL